MMVPSALILVGVLVPVADDPLGAFESTGGVGCLEDDATGCVGVFEVPGE
jgi:hypothetical protein